MLVTRSAIPYLTRQFTPRLFISILAQTGLELASSVLVQGELLQRSNLESVIQRAKQNMVEFENKLAVEGIEGVSDRDLEVRFIQFRSTQSHTWQDHTQA